MFELFSQRMKRQKGEIDIYTYDDFPVAFRNQLFYAINDTIDSIFDHPYQIWESIHNAYIREKGLKTMGCIGGNPIANVEMYCNEAKTIDLLDWIDFVFGIFDSVLRKESNPYSHDRNEKIDAGIETLNYRFQQNSLGYEFVNGMLIRKDNEVIHREYVKPALQLLNDERFHGAEQEYMYAFEARRQGKNEDAITNAAKAFESVMKTICERKNYAYDKQKDTAKVLITKLKDSGFFPAYLQEHLTTIAKTLESGAPTMRNKDSGHGQGAEIRDIPDSYADYVLGLVAVNTVFLVNLYKESK